ncbi:MAG: hypothetical protein ACREQV_25915, partial [Candidatus Binatia bacterium]
MAESFMIAISRTRLPVIGGTRAAGLGGTSERFIRPLTAGFRGWGESSYLHTSTIFSLTFTWLPLRLPVL